MPLKFLLAFAFAALSMAAAAKPAPWFWWVSKVDGARICMQTSPGSGWFRLGEPYNNRRCSDAPLH